MDATPKPVRAPLWQRLFRSLALASLTLVVTLLSALVVLGALPLMRAAVSDNVDSLGGFGKSAMLVVVLGLIFAPLALLVIAARRKWVTWKFLLLGWAVVLPVAGWLAWDEAAIRHPLPIEEFSPAFAGAEQSYALLMRYGKAHPVEEARAFVKWKPAVEWSAESTTREPAKWLAFVAKNRAGLESDWAALAPQRRWLEELAAFDRIGDLTPSAIDADIPTFQIWRTLSQRTCAYATVLALDGRRDEALGTLVPMLGVARKLQLSSRTLVRTMIAVVIERMCVETAGIILDQGPVSPDTRTRLVVALGDENAAPLARRLMLMEYVHFAPVFLKLKLGDALLVDTLHSGPWRRAVRGPLNLLSGLLINPNATANLYGQNVYELAGLAETRELGKFSVRSRALVDDLLGQPRIKNLGGRLVLQMAVPAYDKVLESHWKTADLRVALRARLTAG